MSSRAVVLEQWAGVASPIDAPLESIGVFLDLRVQLLGVGHEVVGTFRHSKADQPIEAHGKVKIDLERDKRAIYTIETADGDWLIGERVFLFFDPVRSLARMQFSMYDSAWHESWRGWMSTDLTADLKTTWHEWVARA